MGYMILDIEGITERCYGIQKSSKKNNKSLLKSPSSS